MYKVARVIIGENKTFVGGEAYLKQRGIEVIVLQHEECQDMMRKFIDNQPDIWYAQKSVRDFGLSLNRPNFTGMKILESQVWVV